MGIVCRSGLIPGWGDRLIPRSKAHLAGMFMKTTYDERAYIHAAHIGENVGAHGREFSARTGHGERKHDDGKDIRARQRRRS